MKEMVQIIGEAGGRHGVHPALLAVMITVLERPLAWDPALA